MIKKGFDKKQIPIAIGAVILVVAIIILILVLVPGDKKDKETTTKKSKTTTTQKSDSTTSTTEEKTNTTTYAPTADYGMQGSVLVVGNSAMELYSVAKGSLTNYGTLISNFAKLVPDKKVYICLCPSSVEFNGPEEYRTGSHSQAEGMKIAYAAATGSNVITVDTISEIKKHTGEYLYFRTDHHWTQRGAYYAYKAFALAAGLTITDIDSMKKTTYEGYVGTMYGYSGGAQVLKDNPDTIEMYYPKSFSTSVGKIFSDAAMTTGGNTFPIVNQNATSYAAAFVSGDQPLEQIVTGNKNGKKCVVIKNSFGNAFVPFLIDNYEEVYIVDPRKITMSLKDFVNANNISDVLFVTNFMAPSISAFMNPLKTMLA